MVAQLAISAGVCSSTTLDDCGSRNPNDEASLNQCDPHRFAVDSECAGDRAHRYATAVKFHCFSGFVDRESVLDAYNVVPGEMFRDGCTVHTILLSQVSDAETSEVIGDKPIYFCRGEKGLRFSNPPDAGPSHVLNGSVIGPLRHPVGPSFPARNQRF